MKIYNRYFWDRSDNSNAANKGTASPEGPKWDAERDIPTGFEYTLVVAHIEKFKSRKFVE